MEDIKNENLENQIEKKDELVLPEAESIEKNEDASYDQIVENSRQDLQKAYKKGRTRSNLMMVVVMAFIVGSMVLITRENATLKIVGWVLVGVAVLGMIIFYALTKNILPKQTKEYIAVVNKTLNGRNFSNNQFEEITTDVNEKIELSDVISDGVYKGSNIGSRNVIHGKFAKRSITVADLALYKNSNPKQRESAFVGKYISYPNELHFEGRILFNIKKKEDAYDQPDDVSDLSVLEENDELIVYGKEGTNFRSILGNEFVDKLLSIKLANYLYNLVVVIWSGHTACYASYGDEVISLPFEKPFDKEANEQFKSNLEDLLNALALLTK